MSESERHARRIAEELCAAAGHPGRENADRLLAGQAMSVGGRVARLVIEKSDPDHIYAYIDFGAPRNPARAYERMLKINFEMAAGKLGVFGLHQNGHAVYGIRYPLIESSKGVQLLAWLMRVVDDITAEGFLNP